MLKIAKGKIRLDPQPVFNKPALAPTVTFHVGGLLLYSLQLYSLRLCAKFTQRGFNIGHYHIKHSNQVNYLSLRQLF
jgi:hypothetical protein